jgi:quinol monooxygenase YgiN
VYVLAMTDPGLILVAEVHGLVGRAAELHALMAELAAGAGGEPECGGLRVLTTEEPGEFVLLGSWRDERALSAHYATPHYRSYREAVGPLLARPSDVVVHHVSSTVHARDPNPPDPGLFG